MKTDQILKSIEQNGVVTEQQIKLLCRRMNNGENIDVSYIWDNQPELTPEQNKKGIDFLMNQYKTPTGAIRKNNPFGYREQEILENFKNFTLIGFYDAGRYGNKFFVPLYGCNSESNGFEYYYLQGVQIVG